MLQVKVKNNNVEYALRLLKRKVKESGLLIELREREYYKKPSAKRAAQKKLGKVRNWMAQQKLNPDWCGEPPTSGLKEKIKKEKILYKK
ncbi:30S ribosomal protein S21 [Candidatus Woesearchaeota archaeon]|jgi:small subunit ribosomal protein S21|nr:30S ribosomal protein S21 [Candidatus Woesearchaeota archaeon]MBT4730770.1 30S ribosomal protein S21 [Candidatus Woesearchaeota archaeon]MBT4935837.1 30S ribosomal protein S21 [Candidatus Woesearchaeota archaeon]MBT5759825.1 30S ribosomal protein S21 [Candidatus Neomarinimicrobiota bacterium]MBT7558041.1 30S ribosomal protein S21 [Candidatus Woesearchaeota archaeon]